MRIQANKYRQFMSIIHQRLLEYPSHVKTQQQIRMIILFWLSIRLVGLLFCVSFCISAQADSYDIVICTLSFLLCIAAAFAIYHGYYPFAFFMIIVSIHTVYMVLSSDAIILSIAVANHPWMIASIFDLTSGILQFLCMLILVIPNNYRVYYSFMVNSYKQARIHSTNT